MTTEKIQELIDISPDGDIKEVLSELKKYEDQDIKISIFKYGCYYHNIDYHHKHDFLLVLSISEIIKFSCFISNTSEITLFKEINKTKKFIIFNTSSNSTSIDIEGNNISIFECCTAFSIKYINKSKLSIAKPDGWTNYNIDNNNYFIPYEKLKNNYPDFSFPKLEKIEKELKSDITKMNNLKIFSFKVTIKQKSAAFDKILFEDGIYHNINHNLNKELSTLCLKKLSDAIDSKEYIKANEMYFNKNLLVKYLRSGKIIVKPSKYSNDDYIYFYYDKKREFAFPYSKTVFKNLMNEAIDETCEDEMELRLLLETLF